MSLQALHHYHPPTETEDRSPQTAELDAALEASLLSDRTDDLWWPELVALVVRSNRLNRKKDGLLGALGSAHSVLDDPGHAALVQEIIAFSLDCDWVRANWEYLWEGEQADAVAGLQYTADSLEAEVV